MKDVTKGKPKGSNATKSKAATISKSSEKLKATLEALHGAYAEPVPTPRGSSTPAVMYKLMGKIFAILSVRGTPFVIVKCDPALAEIMRHKYSGIGHRSHLDRRFWISIDLDAKVPLAEIRKLIAGSYDLIYASLTRKQMEELGTKPRG